MLIFDFRISTIREWIEQELQIPNLPFEYDLENIIDDWVLLCFFVGNDFLPHLPSLDIKEGAIDKLVGIYKSKLWFWSKLFGVRGESRRRLDGLR